MPSQRDYMIATVLGEDNLGTPEGQAAIIDSIFNRQNAILSGLRTPGYYEAKSSSIQDIVTANKGNQYNTWKGTPEEAGNAARAARALQGRDATSGREREQYDQIAKIYDEYMAGQGGWQGISQGATFYQTPKSAADGSFQNKFYRLNGGDNFQDIGSHRFSGEEGQYFKDKNAFYQANPQLYNPNAGAGWDPSSPLNPGVTTQGPGDFLGVGLGDVNNLGRPYETGGTGYGFSGSDVSSGVGLGFNNLGGATPFGNVTPLAFAGDRNFAGGVGPGSLNPSLTPYDPAPDAYAFAGGFNPSQGVGPGSLAPSGLTNTPLTDTASTIGAPAASGGLPSFFSPVDYINANADLSGMSNQQAIDHYLNYGQYETRALAPWLQASVHSAPGGTSTIGAPGLSSTLGPSTTTTLGSGSTASTIGAPSAVNGLPPGFSEQAYMIANPDVAASGQSAADHFLRWGQYDVRALAPGEEARVHAAPGSISPYGGTVQASTYLPPQPTQTLGPDGSVNVMSSGLVPTQGPPGLTPTQGPGPTIIAQTGTFNPDEYLRANADVAASGQSALDHFRNYGAREGRAIDTLGNHFNGDAYLAANRDVAMAGLNPLEHFLRYGAQEARTLAPTDWASPLTAFTNAGTYGAPAATQTLGPSGFTPTIDAPSLTSTIGPPALSGTYGPPAATSTLAPPMAMPSYSPGGGINNPFGFSNANVGSGLGATSQSFSSFYPLDTNIGYSSGGSSGGGGAISDPFAFSGADVSGFDVNAAPPADSGGQGGGGGGGGTAKGSSSSAAFLADQARTRAYWDSLVKPADLYGNTNTHTTPVVAPVVPNLTVQNLGNAMPGAMFNTFAPWR